ncbi:MAG TPA: class I SAM-dependent methyltransferase [Anaerolineales bacterium]|jgi:ubiquinone/menaquinone biosynthesis C-methylase UbiE|nr:class I SAM-dependent methyltransferase [Anaerolineales bacterium]
MDQVNLISRIAAYWDEHIHDLSITTYPVGTREFFQQLDEYRYDKLNYLPRLVDVSTYQGKSLLEVGCGAGIDLVRFARAGAVVTGIDLSTTAIELARKNIEQNGLKADLWVMNGESMQFPDNSFDVVYAHGVLQYTADVEKMVAEIHRVVKPGGEVVVMVYNRNSWLNLMRRVTKVSLEHEDAPVLKKYSISELKQFLKPFKNYRIVSERFPVKTKLHSGWKARLFNDVFVGTFNLMPKALVRPLGWHLMAFATK